MGKKSRVISTLLIGATLSTMGHSVFAVESKETIERKMLAGEDRYETAVKVSKHGWTSAKNVVLVNSTAISDALAATPFAKLKDAPILLTTSKALTDSTKDELKRLQTENVYIVGGGSVISKDVVKELNDMGIKTERIFGSNREETAIAIAKNIDSKEVAVVNGYTGLADALSIAPVAADKQMPILISSKDDLGKTGEYIKEKKIESSYVLGEKGVISEEVEKALPKAERIGGENRRETNSKVLEKFYSEKEFSNIYVAKDGSKDVGQLVDALSISTVAGKEKSPLVLVGKDISGGQKTYLESKTVKTLYEVGNGINANTVENIIKALSIKEVTPEPDPDPNEAAKVHSVKAINGIQLEVKFNKPVDEDSATDLFNYEIKDEDNKDVLNDSEKKTSLIELKEDKKTAIITLRQGYGIKYNQVDLDVEVSNVYTEDKKEKVADFKSEVRVLSTGLPELLDIKQVGPKEYNLTFSEPVTAKNSNEIRNALRVNKEYPSSIETRIDNPGLDANVVRMITSSELKDGEHELIIKDGIYNYGGFKCEEGSKNFTALKDESNITAVVDKVKSDELTLKFNKSLDIDTVKDDNVEFYLDYVNEDYKLDVEKVEDNKVTLSYGGFPLGDHKIVIKYKNKKDDKIKDLWGKELEETSISYSLQGETAPTVKAEYNRFNKTIDLKFSKAVTGADDYESYVLTNADGDEEDLEEVEIKCKDDGKKEYTIDASGLEGKYTLEIVKNKIRDTTVARVPVEETSLEIEVADTTEAEVKMVTYGGEDGDQIFVRFSEAMRTEGTGSVLDKKNYLVTYNGGKPKQLDEIDGAEIDIKGDNDLVQITLPDKIEKGDVSIHIGSVADANGKFTGLGGISIEKVYDDRIISIPAINSVEDLDVEQQGNIAVKDASTIEFYVDREILLLNQKNVEFKLGDETLNPSSQEIEEDEDLDGNIVYKVTLEFDEEIFNTDGKIDYKDIKTGTIQFKEEAFTTINESVSKEMKFDIDNSKTDVIVDKAAPIIKTATILGDKKIQLDFSEEVNSNHISASTFEIEDYDVEKIEKGESEKTIILVLDKEITENSIKVKQVQPIRDKFKNKTTDMEEPKAKYHGPIVEKAEIDDTNKNITITFKEEIEKVKDVILKDAIIVDDNSIDSVNIEGKVLKIVLKDAFKSEEEDIDKNIKINAGALKNKKDDYKSREINEKITIKAK